MNGTRRLTPAPNSSSVGTAIDRPALSTSLVTHFAQQVEDGDEVANRLEKYHLEVDGSVRTAASIGYYESLANRTSERDRLLIRLVEEVSAIGGAMDANRQAAFAGLIALNALDRFTPLNEGHSDRSVTVDVFSILPNTQLLAYVARRWSAVKSALGENLASRLSRYKGDLSDSWKLLAPFINESEELRLDFLDHCAKTSHPITAPMLEALSRELPKSRLLRAHCLKSLGSLQAGASNSPYDHMLMHIVAAKLFAKQFPSDALPATAGINDRPHEISRTAAIVILAIVNPSHPYMKDLIEAIRNEVDGFYWPEAAYLCSATGANQDFIKFINKLLSKCTGSLWECLPICLEPIVERIRGDEEVEQALLAQLMNKSATGSAKASIPRLLKASSKFSTKLSDWCEEEYARQTSGNSITEFGFDLIAGRVRPIAHTLLDTLASTS